MPESGPWTARLLVTVFLVMVGVFIWILGRPIGGNDQSTGWGLYRVDFLRISLSLLACWASMLLLVVILAIRRAVDHPEVGVIWRQWLPWPVLNGLIGVTILLIALGVFNHYMQVAHLFNVARTAITRVVTTQNKSTAQKLVSSGKIGRAVSQAKTVEVSYELATTNQSKIYLATLGDKDKTDVVLTLARTSHDPLKLWNTYTLKQISSVDEY